MPSLRLEVNQVARFDLKMEPGEISELVTVTRRSPILDTEDVEFGTVIDEPMILDLPLQDRDLLSLAYLTTGAIRERILHTDDRYSDGGGWPSFNGLYSTSNQFTLDGSGNDSALKHKPIVGATPETVQEFKVITNNYSAEYGRSGGAVISMLSKSGSNEFHGRAWYYVRDERFDAANFFTNRLGREQETLGLSDLWWLLGRSHHQGQDLLSWPLRALHRRPGRSSVFNSALPSNERRRFQRRRSHWPDSPALQSL